MKRFWLADQLKTMLGRATNREPCLFFPYPEGTVPGAIAAHVPDHNTPCVASA